MTEVKHIVFTKKGDNVISPVIVKEYSVKPTKNGGEYIEGVLQCGKAFSFKVWSSSAAFTELRKYDYKGRVAVINGSFDDYNGIQSIIIDTISASSEYTPEQFLEVKYNKDAFYEALKQTVAKQCSSKGVELLSKMFFTDEELTKAFCLEFAAKSHHDNCMSGLLAHTFKAVSMLSWVLAMYPALVCSDENKAIIDADKKDLFIIGMVLHDIGKVKELNMGVYTSESVVTHNVLGMDLLYKFRDEIEATYSPMWFRYLQSILSQHHGEWGERPKTVYSYIIHKVDEMEAKCTELSTKIADANLTDDPVFNIDSYYLHF